MSLFIELPQSQTASKIDKHTMGNKISGRYSFTIKASVIHVPVQEIRLESSTGWIEHIDASDKFTPDDVIIEFNKALKKMKLEPVPARIMNEALTQAVGEKLPRYVELSKILLVYNNIHLHHDYDPMFSELRLYWAERYRMKAIKVRINSRGNEGSSFYGLIDEESKFDETEGYLKLELNGFSLLAYELDRFGGFTKRFHKNDALSIMYKCAKRRETISCKEFVAAMEKCVNAILTPSLYKVARPSSSAMARFRPRV